MSAMSMFCQNHYSRRPVHTPLTTDIWAQQLTQLQLWMTQTDTAPTVQHCLLSTFEHHGRQTFGSFSSPICHMAAQDQDWIGLFGLMVGHFSSRWLAIQAAHYFSSGSSCSASLRLVHLCHQMLLFTHTLWLSRNEQVWNTYATKKKWFPHEQQSIPSSDKSLPTCFPLIIFMWLRASPVLLCTRGSSYLWMISNFGSMQCKMPKLADKVLTKHLKKRGGRETYTKV